MLMPPLGMHPNPVRLLLAALVLFVWVIGLRGFNLVQLEGWEANIWIGLGLLLALHRNATLSVAYVVFLTTSLALHHLFRLPFDPVFWAALSVTYTMASAYREYPLMRVLQQDAHDHPLLHEFARHTSTALENHLPDKHRVELRLVGRTVHGVKMRGIAYRILEDDRLVGVLLVHTPASRRQVDRLARLVRVKDVPVVARSLRTRYAFGDQLPQLLQELGNIRTSRS